MKKMLIFLIILNSGCSTLRKSKIAGTSSGIIICGVLGSAIGKLTSPDARSENLNQTIGGVSGATLCGVGGYFLSKALYRSDPRNFEDKPIIFEQKKEVLKQETLPEVTHDLNLRDLRFKKTEEVTLPLVKNLPESLKKKVKKQKVIHYKVGPQTILTKDGRTLYFSGGEAIEHIYQ